MQPDSVAAADLNGDGKPDLAVTNNLAGDDKSLSLLLNNGNGTFANKVDYSIGHEPRALVAADLNSDGKLDLAACNSIGDAVGVLFSNGDGTFVAHVDYPIGPGGGGLVAADLNGDGRPDLALTGGGGTVTVLFTSCLP
jgi:hypothetical protein